MDLKNPNTYVGFSALALSLAGTGFVYTQVKSQHGKIEELEKKVVTLMREQPKFRSLFTQMKQYGGIFMKLDQNLEHLEDEINSIKRVQHDQNKVLSNLTSVLMEVKNSLADNGHKFENEIEFEPRFIEDNFQKQKRGSRRSGHKKRKNRKYTSNSDSYDSDSSGSDSRSDDSDSYDSDSESESSDNYHKSRRNPKKRHQMNGHSHSKSRIDSSKGSKSRHVRKSTQKQPNGRSGSSRSGSNKGRAYKPKNRTSNGHRRPSRNDSEESEGDLDDLINMVDKN